MKEQLEEYEKEIKWLEEGREYNFAATYGKCPVEVFGEKARCFNCPADCPLKAEQK